MKYLKYGLIALAAIIIVIGAVFAYVAATFDPNEYKGDIVELVKEKTGRTLNIEGDIRLTFFPKIGVGLGPTQLSERDSRNGVCRGGRFACGAGVAAIAVEADRRR